MKKRFLLLAALCFAIIQAWGQVGQVVQMPMRVGSDVTQLKPVPTEALGSIKLGEGVMLPKTVKSASHTDDYPTLSVVDGSISIVEGCFAPGASYAISVTFINVGEDFSGDLYFTIVSTDWSVIYHLSLPTTVTIPQGGEQQVVFYGQCEADMSPGQYYGTFAFFNDDSNTIYYGISEYFNCTVEPALKFSATSVSMVSGYFAPGVSYAISATFVNSGVEISDDLYFVLTSTDGVLRHISSPATVTIPQGGSLQVVFYGQIELDLPPGEYCGAFVTGELELILCDAGGAVFSCIVDSTIIGTCGLYGDNLVWKLTDDGTLTISGEGEMMDYNTYYTLAPWYKYRDKIHYIVLEEGMTSIGNYAFDGCSSVTTYDRDNGGIFYVSIPEGVTSIGKGAFSYFSGLVRIPSSVKSIEEGAFSYTDRYDGWYTNGVLYIDSCLIDVKPEEMSVSYAILPDTRVIADNAFEGCGYWLNSVHIPGSVKNIGRNAFEDCGGLTQMTVSASTPPAITGTTFSGVSKDIVVYVPGYSIDVYRTAVYWQNLTRYASCTPWGVCGAQSGNLKWELGQDGILTISGEGEMAGYGISPWHLYLDSIRSLVVNKGATNIADGAFRGCTNLTTADLPEGLTDMGDYAFSGCTNLALMNIPTSVTNIGNEAYSGCTGLTSVVFPRGMVSIGDSAFFNCTGLTSIICHAPIPPSIGSHTFEGINRNTPVYVPAESLLYYISHPYWGTLFIQPLPDYSGIVATALQESITVQDGEVHINMTGIDAVQVYDLQGYQVLRTTERHFALPQGIYIIKVGDEAVKVSL